VRSITVGAGLMRFDRRARDLFRQKADEVLSPG
jgi:hypothetical protein